ncbi:MAG: glycosyltransferase family 2 protein [Deltaproteobacteria bacterium]
MKKKKTRTVTLVLVVRNEERGLGEMLPKIPLNIYKDVFAIDGNSKDRTRDILRDAGIRTYVQKSPGLGAAMLEARQYVKTDSFIFFHPDGNENPEDLDGMAGILRDGADFVVASRMIRGAWNEEDEKILKWRKWANIGFAVLANLFFAHNGNKTTDVTNGFRGISTDAFDRMRLSSVDLTMDYQMVIRALKLNIRITEFPTREGERIGGNTNFPSMSTGIAELKLLGREIKMGRRTARGAQ